MGTSSRALAPSDHTTVLTRFSGGLAWGSLALSLVLISAAAWLQVIGRQPVSYDWGFRGYEGILALVFALVGGIVGTRRPTNPVGRIFWLLGLGGAIQYLTAEYSLRAIVIAPGSLPAASFAAWVQDWIWVPLIWLIGLLFLLFPRERLSNKPSRRVALLGTAAFVATLFSWAFLPPRLESFDLDNPVGLLSDPATAEAITGLSSLAMILCIAWAGLLLLTRFRRTTGVEHQQLKWFVFASALASLGLIIGIAPPTSSPGSLLAVAGLALVPIATGIAILRYRLFDIDRIINRTLVYGALTASLATAYFVGVTVLQPLLRPITGTSSLAVAGSTLVVAALFGPLRARIQTLIDRRFYRHSYDAARTLEAFSTRLRGEVDFDALTQELLTVTAKTMQPAHVSLWLEAPESRSEDKSRGR
jgi:hypothetical protein